MRKNTLNRNQTFKIFDNKNYGITTSEKDFPNMSNSLELCLKNILRIWILGKQLFTSGLYRTSTGLVGWTKGCSPPSKIISGKVEKSNLDKVLKFLLLFSNITLNPKTDSQPERENYGQLLNSN